MNETRQLIIKPTSLCNFNCTFCSARKMNIPLNTHVPEELKKYLLSYKPTDIIITGGEPLMNPKSYFEDLISIMDSTKIDYNIGLTSNMMLWYNNPEKYDWLFTHPKISVDTSFQYGEARRDTEVYTEERFIDLFNKFYERYKIKLMFISVISSENENTHIRLCELAKKLGTQVKINCQIKVGAADTYFPRYKLLKIYLDLIDKGLDQYEQNLCDRHIKYGLYKCPFSKSYQNCLQNKVVYVDKHGTLIQGNCEEIMSSDGQYDICKGVLFPKCYMCPMFNICNGCSLNRQNTEAIKEEHCKWMQEHYQQLKENYLI